MTPSDDPRLRKYLDKFVDLARERLGALNNALLVLETEPENIEVTTEMMRQLHTLKGESRLVKQDELSHLAHRVEEVLLRARDGGFRAVGLRDLCFQSFDVMSVLVEKASGATTDISTEPLLERISAALDAPPTVGVQVPVSAPVPTAKAMPGAVAHVRVGVDKLERLTSAATALIPQHRLIEVRMQEVKDLVERWSASMQESDARGDGTLRELAREAQLGVTALLEQHFDLGIALRDTRDRAQALRLVSLTGLFAQYPRAIRDLASESGKSVAIDVEGADVEVDKEIVDALHEPLIHLLRNCVDHGIEAANERVAAGKEERGRINLLARSRGAEVEVVVSDDGRGIAVDAVRSLAVTRGVSTPQQVAQLSSRETLDLLFLPGFSTAKETTDVSGRGIGLNVVRQRITALGGSTEVSSEVGRGTTVTLRVPVSMVVTKVLLVSVSGASYAVGSRDVRVVMEHEPALIEQFGPALLVRVDDDRVPLFELDSLLGLAPGGERTVAPRIVVVSYVGQSLALIVDSIEGEREVTQRGFDGFLSASKVASGTTVAEMGRVSVLLSAAQLVSLALARGRALVDSSARGSEDGDEGNGFVALVVDDSELVRTLLVTLLSAHGYRVREASHGAEALEALGAEAADVILADLDMPVMDGFELIHRIRTAERTKHTPIVVLSARGSESERLRVLELGGDAYLSKKDFDEERLCKTVAGLVQRR